MQLCLFQMRDDYLLAPNLSPLDFSYKQRIDSYANGILFCMQSQPNLILSVPPMQLNDIVSLHCDKWIEETALHMNLYASAHQTPQLQSSAPATVQGTLPIITHKSFSGDASGVIGEALFIFTFTEHFGLNMTDFTHFRASKSTGIFPDFGIHAISEELQHAFDRHGIAVPNLIQIHLIPAEVKAMTSPNLSIIKERLDKAVRQLRNFWRIRALGAGRGASIIFMALRNPDRTAYDGVILWID